MDSTLINSILQHELQCCRVCLMTDCRLYNIHDYKLADTFTRISGTTVSRDGLPQYLCAYCLVLLLKCSSFRDMCLRTMELLTPALLKGALDTDYIRKYQTPHRSLNLTQTELEIIELNPYYDLFNKQILNEHIVNEQIMPVVNEVSLVIAPDIQEDLIEISNDDSEQLVLKDEIISKIDEDEIKTETSILKNVLLTKKVLKSKKNIKTPKKTKNILKTETNLKRKRQTKTKVEENLKTGQVNEGTDIDKNIMKTGNENKEIMRIMTMELKDDKIEFNGTNEADDGVGNNDDYNEIEEVPVETKKRKRGKNTRSLPEFNLVKFGRTINHKTVTLSKEEQLEEIAMRKKSQIYLDSPFKCEDCGNGFGLESTYNNHRARHSSSSRPHSCDICTVRFLWRSQLNSHQGRHRMKFICNQCNFISRDTSQASKHHATHAGKTYKCPHCEKSFINSTTYFSHVRLMHPELNVDCVDCGETFVSKSGLKQHKNRIHALKSSQFVCNMCSAKFNSEEVLKKHIELAGEHREGDLRPCEQCGENCATEEALQEHVRVVHPTEFRHCERCDITFSNAAAFDTHNLRKHLGQRYQAPPRKRIRGRKQVMCDQCGHTVQSPSLLEYHKRTHLAVKPCACPHCPKTFALPSTLTDHIRSHTGEKPYQCPECPHAFTLKGNFTRHYKVAHLGKRDSFPCPVCGNKFTTSSSMKVHLRAVHGGAGWPKRDCSKRTRRKRNTKTNLVNK
ncbi:zinc finger protein 879-like [Cydia pomonella]|uniref:zinc finger protein 879-like n=1 Tax=Cydia pomonella TaxID=82600 RepID=UPI002ADDC85F|nr:zinc finger protein 879-like [Cydia pomonella]